MTCCRISAFVCWVPPRESEFSDRNIFHERERSDWEHSGVSKVAGKLENRTRAEFRKKPRKRIVFLISICHSIFIHILRLTNANSTKNTEDALYPLARPGSRKAARILGKQKLSGISSPTCEFRKFLAVPRNIFHQKQQEESRTCPI